MYGRIKRIEIKWTDKISDCIDIQCEIEPVAFDDMANRTPAESSVSIRERVIKARTIADLEYAATMAAEEAVTAPVLSRHIAEAIGYRALDRASCGQIFELL
ncbi:MAG: hypothetical protein K2K25_07355 [Muribaculaceae bacterium]|nr:hypothetical protein [Muribaculaceae bacterium]